MEENAESDHLAQDCVLYCDLVTVLQSLKQGSIPPLLYAIPFQPEMAEAFRMQSIWPVTELQFLPILTVLHI